MSKTKKQTWTSVSGHEMYYNSDGRPRRVNPPKSVSKVNTKYNEQAVRKRNIERLKPSLPHNVYHSNPTVHHYVREVVVNDSREIDNLKKQIEDLKTDSLHVTPTAVYTKPSQIITSWVCSECKSTNDSDAYICEVCGLENIQKPIFL